MKTRKLWMLGAVPFFLAACAAEEPELDTTDAVVVDPAGAPVTPAPVTTPMDTGMAAGAMAGMENRVQMMALNNSGVTGETMFTEMGQQTQVMLRVMGAPANSTHPAHIHEGTCENQGPVVVPLESVTVDGSGIGSSTSTVDVSLATVMNGQHYVQAHDAGGTPVVCGNIPAMGSM